MPLSLKQAKCLNIVNGMFFFLHSVCLQLRRQKYFINFYLQQQQQQQQRKLIQAGGIAIGEFCGERDLIFQAAKIGPSTAIEFNFIQR